MFDIAICLYCFKHLLISKGHIKRGRINPKKAIRVRVITAKSKNINLLLKDKKVSKSFRYLSKFNNFVLIIINNDRIDKNEKENAILRYYGIGAQIIKDLRVKNMVLVTKTRKKIIGLEGFGLKITKQEIIK